MTLQPALRVGVWLVVGRIACVQEYQPNSAANEPGLCAVCRLVE